MHADDSTVTLIVAGAPGSSVRLAIYTYGAGTLEASLTSNCRQSRWTTEESQSRRRAADGRYCINAPPGHDCIALR